MARRIKNAKLDSRNSRLKLPTDNNPYWVRIEKNAHLGYRKGTRGGYWIARLRLGTGFKMQSIGIADDMADADGSTILDYFQAQNLARSWLQQKLNEEKGITSETGTVAEAMDEYLNYLETHKKSAKFTRYYIDAYIQPVFGHLRLTEITSRKISEWHASLIKEDPSKGRHKRHQNLDEKEFLRRRKSSANRTLTILKACLNMAYYKGKVSSDDAWRRIKPFKNVDSPKVRFLSIGECGRLVNACVADFKPIVQAALLTGCRYGELTNLKAHDFNPDAGTIFVQDSKNSKPRYVSLETQGIRFFTRQVIGKSEYIFPRKDGEKWGKSHQTRRMRDACRIAQIAPAVSFHILRHTYASQL